LIDFGDAPVFDATAYPSIVVLSKRLPTANQTRALNWESGPPLEEFESVFRSKSFWVAQKEFTVAGWRLESPAVLRLLEKLRKAGKPLGDYVDGRFYRGLVTGLNEAFVVDRSTRDHLIAEHPSSAKVLKPWLRGKDIKRWQVCNPDLYLCYIGWELPIEKYPAIYSHLKGFRDQLKARPEVMEGRVPWYALSRYASDYWEEYERPKIIYPDIYEHQTFAFDSKGFYSGNTTYFIPAEDKWLSGLLNSHTVEWFYSLVSNKVRGGYMRAFSDYMRQVPIPPPSNPNPIESLVGQILAAKAVDPAADVSALEHEIDLLVYGLYDLTPEEIAIVEGNSP
jgi:hypothetical protein